MKALMRHAGCACAIVLLLPLEATASGDQDSWGCRNPDLEISCAEGECEVADSHTPISVTATASEVEVCAYSGCWNGEPAASVRAGRLLTYTGVRLRYMLDTDDGAHMSLTIDVKSGIGTILITGMYAQPMICEPM